MNPYTEIDLAVLRTRSEIDAAQELTSLPRSVLVGICQMLAIHTKPHMKSTDLVIAILKLTHPHQAAPTPSASAAEQTRMF